MPTFASKQDMERKNIKDKGITILDEQGKILPVVTKILEIIKEYDMALATGHLSTREIYVLLDETWKVGVERTIVTHPLAPSFGPNASIDEQKRMIREGVFFEHCFNSCMPTGDRLDPRKIAEAIRAVGVSGGCGK